MEWFLYDRDLCYERVKWKYFLIFQSIVILLFMQKQLFTSASQNSYSQKSLKSHRKITVMELFLSKVAACDLTKKEFYHSFFRVNFMKFFRTAFSTSANFVLLYEILPVSWEISQYLSKFGLIYKYRFLTCTRSELFYEKAMPAKSQIIIRNTFVV